MHNCISYVLYSFGFVFFFQAEDGIRDYKVTGVQTCALPIFPPSTYSRQTSAPNILSNSSWGWISLKRCVGKNSYWLNLLLAATLTTPVNSSAFRRSESCSVVIEGS